MADNRAPYLRVVRGDATAEEIAALVTALAAVAAARARAAVQPAPARSNWSDPARRMRTPVHPGPGGWRRSALPE